MGAPRTDELVLLVEDSLTRDPGAAGGPIEVRAPPTLGRGLVVVIEGGFVFEGVPVRDVVAEVPADESCFVGDFVGDFVND